MADTVKELKAQAKELINSGNSKEQAEGHGMMRVLDEIGKYHYIPKLPFAGSKSECFRILDK